MEKSPHSKTIGWFISIPLYLTAGFLLPLLGVRGIFFGLAKLSYHEAWSITHSVYFEKPGRISIGLGLKSIAKKIQEKLPVKCFVQRICTRLYMQLIVNVVDMLLYSFLAEE